MSRRGEHEGDITVAAAGVVTTGKVTRQPGSIVDVEGQIIHNGEMEQSKRTAAR